MFIKYVDEDGEESYNFPNCEKDGHYYRNFVREEEENKILASTEVDENGEPICGPFPFTFDGEKVYNFWEDYPDKLTSEEKAIFDEEYPEMAALKNYGNKEN